LMDPVALQACMPTQPRQQGELALMPRCVYTHARRVRHHAHYPNPSLRAAGAHVRVHDRDKQLATQQRITVGAAAGSPGRLAVAVCITRVPGLRRCRGRRAAAHDAVQMTQGVEAAARQPIDHGSQRRLGRPGVRALCPAHGRAAEPAARRAPVRGGRRRRC